MYKHNPAQFRRPIDALGGRTSNSPLQPGQGRTGHHWNVEHISKTIPTEWTFTTSKLKLHGQSVRDIKVNHYLSESNDICLMRSAQGLLHVLSPPQGWEDWTICVRQAVSFVIPSPHLEKDTKDRCFIKVLWLNVRFKLGAGKAKGWLWVSMMQRQSWTRDPDFS